MMSAHWANEDVIAVKVYLCPGCVRFRPWCDGAADDMPEVCDRCWYYAHLSWWRRLIEALLPRWFSVDEMQLLPEHSCNMCVIEGETNDESDLEILGAWTSETA